MCEVARIIKRGGEVGKQRQVKVRSRDYIHIYIHTAVHVCRYILQISKECVVDLHVLYCSQATAAIDMRDRE